MIDVQVVELVMVVTASVAAAAAVEGFIFGTSVPRTLRGCVCIAASCEEGSFAVVANKVVVVQVAVIVLLSGAARSELASTPWLAVNVETASNARMAEKFIVYHVRAISRTD